MRANLLLGAGRLETLRLLAQIAFLEDEPDHMPLKNRETRRIYRRQPVLIDDHSLAFNPLTPAFGGHVFIDALPQFTGIRHTFQPWSFAAKYNAGNHSSHFTTKNKQLEFSRFV